LKERLANAEDREGDGRKGERRREAEVDERAEEVEVEVEVEVDRARNKTARARQVDMDLQLFQFPGYCGRLLEVRLDSNGLVGAGHWTAAEHDTNWQMSTRGTRDARPVYISLFSFPILL